MRIRGIDAELLRINATQTGVELREGGGQANHSVHAHRGRLGRPLVTQFFPPVIRPHPCPAPGGEVEGADRSLSLLDLPRFHGFDASFEDPSEEQILISLRLRPEGSRGGESRGKPIALGRHVAGPRGGHGEGVPPPCQSNTYQGNNCDSHHRKNLVIRPFRSLFCPLRVSLPGRQVKRLE